jgi:hypothetical protein
MKFLVFAASTKLLTPGILSESLQFAERDVEVKDIFQSINLVTIFQLPMQVLQLRETIEFSWLKFAKTCKQISRKKVGNYHK